MLIRIALTGRSGAGKSEIASILREEFKCEVVSTGRICRAIAQLLFGDDSKSSTQALDDALTTLDASIFLKAALRTSDTTNNNVVIDSLRFTSDANLATDLGFHLLRIEAPDEVRFRRLQTRGQAFDPSAIEQHRSENELDAYPVDGRLSNYGSRDDLREALRRTLRTNLGIPRRRGHLRS